MDYSGETPTLVEFRLEQTATGTLLVVTESGFDKIPGNRRADAFRMNDGGWTQQMKNIEAYVTQNHSSPPARPRIAPAISCLRRWAMRPGWRWWRGSLRGSLSRLPN